MKTMLFAIALAAAAAAATTTSASADPVLEFAAGAYFYQEQNYEVALALFVSAASQIRAPEIYFDAALAHLRLDNPYASRAFLRRYLRLEPRGIERPDVRRLSAAIVDMIMDEPTPRQSIGLDSAVLPGL